MAEFEERFAGALSSTYRRFCAVHGGGFPSEENSYLIPHARHTQYWDYCQERLTDPGGQMDVICLYGITGEEGLDLRKETANTRRVWHLPEEFWVVASDGVGMNLVSRLKEGADEVYLWEPHVDPKLFQISVSLLDFYNSLGPVPYDMETEER